MKDIYNDPDRTYSDEQIELIIKNSPQNHKEAGFEKGWDSRFDTWFKLLKELGFVKYAMGEAIEITETGHMLVDAFNEEPCNDKKIQLVFLNAFAKYQTSNPLRRNLNDNAPLPVLLKVIKYLHDDPDENDAGVAKHELPILICWPDNDAFAIYKFIKKIRKKYGFKCSNDVIYSHCMELLESNNTKLFKLVQICFELVDEYIRKMRMTGLLSLRGNGRFLDINTFEADLAEYVADTYINYKKFTDSNQYVEYMGSIDNQILNIAQQTVSDYTDIRKQTLNEYAQSNTKEFIRQELINLCKRKNTNDPILKYIPEPTRLEFLTSVALVQQYPGLDVNPNYVVDDEGLPINTAGGGKADIECYDQDYDSYYEVSLMCGRSDQINNEIIPIARHLRQVISDKRSESFSVFIAPVVHNDTKEAADWQNNKYQIRILSFDIPEFIDAIEKTNKASDLMSI